MGDLTLQFFGDPCPPRGHLRSILGRFSRRSGFVVQVLLRRFLLALAHLASTVWREISCRYHVRFPRRARTFATVRRPTFCRFTQKAQSGTHLPWPAVGTSQQRLAPKLPFFHSRGRPLRGPRSPWLLPFFDRRLGLRFSSRAFLEAAVKQRIRSSL
jgi:hypothetical protein